MVVNNISTQIPSAIFSTNHIPWNPSSTVEDGFQGIWLAKIWDREKKIKKIKSLKIRQHIISIAIMT